MFKVRGLFFTLTTIFWEGALKFSILGGCATRDIFRLTNNDPLVGSLWGRMSMHSILAKPIQNLIYPVGFVPKNFEIRQSYIDCNKTFMESFITVRPEVLLIDFMSEIYGLGFLGEGCVTIGGETQKRVKELGVELNVVAPFTPERQAIMDVAIPTLIRELRYELHTTMALHEVYQATHYVDSNGAARPYVGLERETIDKANRHLAHIYELVHETFPALPFFKGSKDLLMADSAHAWGASPFHYTSAYHQDAFKSLVKSIERVI